MGNVFEGQFIGNSGLLGILSLELTAYTIPFITYAYFDSEKNSQVLFIILNSSRGHSNKGSRS